MRKAAAAETYEMFKQSILFIYEHMGNVFLMSALWLFASFTVVLIPVATATVYYTVYRLLLKEDVSFRDSFRAFRVFFWRSEALGLLIAALVLLLLIDMSFFATVPKNALVKSASGFMAWPLVFIILASNYVMPILVVKEMGVTQIVKRASLLVLDNLGFTLALGLLSLTLIVFAIMPPFLVLAFAATLGCLQVQATVHLLTKYGADDRQKNTTP